MEKKFVGIVKDDMKTMDTLYTKTFDAYKEAREAAENLCKKTMGDRGKIDVEESLIFTITETNLIPGAAAKTMQIKFNWLKDGHRIACKSSDYKKMVKTFAGLDGIIYATSVLFENFDFEIDDGEQVVFAHRSLVWPEIRDCEGDIIDRGDILLNGIGPECRYVVADFDSLEEVGDGSTWRAVDYLHEGEDLEQALIRIEKEVNR